MKRLVCLILALGMVMLAGCAANQQTTDGTTPTTVPAADPATQPATVPDTVPATQPATTPDTTEPTAPPPTTPPTVPVEEVVCPPDNVIEITEMIERDNNKVVTEPSFEIPDKLAENPNAFRLPALVSDRMLLQALAVNRIWGSCTEDGPVAVRLTDTETGNTQVYYGNCENGAFLVYVGSNPHGMKVKLEIITASGSKRTIHDIIFGELFLGCGQSNMGWTVGQCYSGTTATLLYQEEIDSSYNEDIRLFGLLPNQSNAVVSDVYTSSTNGWQIAQPHTIVNFSAASYFFARELNRMYNVPVGVICSCMGGTDIYTWTPAEEAGECQGTVTDASTFYNAMIYPLRHVNARGVLWYQGEGSEAVYYAHNLSLLVQGWRRLFERDNLFFAIVQLPRYAANDSGSFERREAQKEAALSIPFCTYSVNIDLGTMTKDVAEGDDLNPYGIHPYDKLPLGNRLAHVVAKDVYHAEGVWSSPYLEAVTVEGNRAVLKYANVGAGLVLRGQAGFEILGSSGKTYACVPTLRSKTEVELTIPEGETIRMIRYGYASSSSLVNHMERYADCVSLYNTKNNNQVAYPAEQFIWKG